MVIRPFPSKMMRFEPRYMRRKFAPLISTRFYYIPLIWPAQGIALKMIVPYISLIYYIFVRCFYIILCRIGKHGNSHFCGLKRSGGSGPVSRVLSWMVIPLDAASPLRSCDLPGNRAGTHDRPPIGSCSGWGLPCHDCCQSRGALLPHLFTLTGNAGGMFSVALAVGSRPPGVTWHPSLWSPDFPPPEGSDHPAHFHFPSYTPYHSNSG